MKILKRQQTKMYHTFQAFTLLETLTSIAILSLVLIGPLTVIMGSTSYARQTKDVMTATYLAEESIELLQNQYDTLYIFCKNNAEDPYCATSTEEVGGQIPWRLFKARLGSMSGQPSCYVADNPDGCSFDYLDMLNSPTTTPTRYIASGQACSQIIGVGTEYEYGMGGNGGPVTLFTYACKGVGSHLSGTLTAATFSRKVAVEQLATFEGSTPVEDQYNDDLRVTATVAFKGVNGVAKNIEITRFFHARP